METISKDKLFEVLANVKSSTIVTVTRSTTPKMKKTGNPYFANLIEKITVCQYNFNMSYINSINKRIDKCSDGQEKQDYELAELKGKSWVVPNKILQGKDDYLVRFFEMKNTKPKSDYKIDGNLATPEQIAIIKQFLPASAPVKKQLESGITENEQVVIRDIKLSNILSIKIGGNHYVIE